MKVKTLLTLALSLCLTGLVPPVGAASPFDAPGTLTVAYGQVSVPGVADVDKSALLKVVAGTSGPVIIEFYDSQAGDASGECARQKPVFDQVAAHYAGKAVFLRFDIAQDRDFAEALRVTVCPSFLFMNHNQAEPNRLSKRHWGFLSRAQFEELIEEYFSIKP